MKKLIIIIIASLVLLTSCNPYSVIIQEDIKEAMIWTQKLQRDMTEDEISSFLEKYNSSKYGGKATEEGGTPDFGVSITLTDGKKILVNDFYGKVEIYSNGKSFYLENEKLYELIKSMSGFSLNVTH